MRIEFTIKGNHQDPFGNAFPKLKMTGKQHWMPKAQAYAMWKSYVQNALLKSGLPIDLIDRFNKSLAFKGKPIELEKGQHARMDLLIAWKDGHHGDPENIFGSIADALFVNDKNLWGSFSPLVGEHGGKVVCIITVSDALIE